MSLTPPDVIERSKPATSERFKTRHFETEGIAPYGSPAMLAGNGPGWPISSRWWTLYRFYRYMAAGGRVGGSPRMCWRKPPPSFA